MKKTEKRVGQLVKALKKQLEDFEDMKGASEKASAIAELEEIGLAADAETRKQVFAALVDALSLTFDVLHMQAGMALGKVGERASNEEFAALWAIISPVLEQDSFHIQGSAVTFFFQNGERSRPLLSKIMEEGSEMAKVNSAGLLWFIDGTDKDAAKALSFFEHALDNFSPEAQRVAVICLRKIRHPQAQQLMIKTAAKKPELRAVINEMLEELASEMGSRGFGVKENRKRTPGRDDFGRILYARRERQEQAGEKPAQKGLVKK